jgi:hypothetical protein
MRFLPTPLAGAFVIELDKREDDPGFFAASFASANSPPPASIPALCIPTIR